MAFEQDSVFIEKIDCRFPFLDAKLCFDLIDEASLLSPHSMFKVIEEISRIQDDDRESVSIEFLRELLKTIDSKFNHPLKPLIIGTAQVMIQGNYLSVEETINKMEIVRKYPQEYMALNILYYSCDDVNGIMEPVYKKIISEWQKNVT